ncbi:carboxypeptidase regulatory-like domain-containing protein [Paremcibacter congregatus]|uniref:TonB-dependent receptor n=1 Tax=Paremcibacter congregatus TaxID=2043170 RepID=A0A2G4YQT0_9PROT|nr:carboxypeptidase regulatory-like domain-containing protein [Paremcibacter congregatus]PHZ84681.1 TonB-dependent receptor [Paremcibacter congregatus]QDE28875.1 carboxypeptidase regulatory-like domain-containing protein [Paremcibacter congregatus]
MLKISKLLRKPRLSATQSLTWAALASSMLVISAPAVAQQAGGVTGRITQADGTALAGVTIEARGDVLPQPRTTTSAENGRYQLPLLPPGNYVLTFKFPDGSEQKRNVAVKLQQKSKVDMAQSQEFDEIVVVGTQSSVVTGRASLKNSISSATIEGLPVGQDYRDLQKLIPGVQYSEDTRRGPNAGGSGQDNMYQFDGVDISLPMFGTLSAEPSSHDIDQVSVVRGGATAIGFNRSGGFLMNTISKRGTDEFHGEISYKTQTAGMTGSRKNGDTPLEFDEDRTWITANLSGPIIKDRLFFYTSYYRPTKTRDNVSNAYGDVPNYSSKRNEFFGKLTFSPTDDILLDASYRTSDRSDRTEDVGSFTAASAANGSDTAQDIAIVEGSWIVDEDSSLSFKFTNFELKSTGRPDTLFDFPRSLDGKLDVSALDKQGLFLVPKLRDLPNQTDVNHPDNNAANAFNAFATPLVNKYGYLDNGVAAGGGVVGGGSTINDQDFSRISFEVAYDRSFYAGDTTHDVHIGYQYQEIEEDLARNSNGWGIITAHGGETFAEDGVTPVYYVARLNQMSLEGVDGTALVPSIKSKSKLQSLEINDTIETGDFTINVGALISNDILFGQGLREKEGTVSGYEVALGNQYKMYEVDWTDMIQPRFGINWDYSDTSAVYVNYARYNPSASSLARAASWGRNLQKTVDVFFDEAGNIIESTSVRSSSGKVFQEDMSPRKIDEFLIGWNSQITDGLMLRAHVRYREGGNFWEDTENNARSRFEPPAGTPTTDYVPNLADIRAEIGGSSYVIAQLDNAYTHYWEVSAEAEYTTENLFVSASYVWSRYTGNFDQDNTTTKNDADTFIGSSFIADGAGRQLWNFREGFLRGDRRHQFKLYGYYQFDWDGQLGAFLIAQSGQPWEKWDYSLYSHLTGSKSDTSRYAEPAGSRRTDAHVQLDLSYTQNIEVYNGYTVQLRADLFNVFDKQTGYNIQNKVNSAGFGEARSFYNPRRLQLTAKFRF